MACLVLLGSVHGASAEPSFRELSPEEEAVAPGESAVRQTQEALAEGIAEERARSEWLASPSAAEERAASQSEHKNLSVAEIKDLLLEEFPAVFERLNADPARALTDVAIRDVLGPTTALVGTEEKPQLLDSPIGILDYTAEGEREPVSLDVVWTGEGFQAENPVTPVELPEDTEEAIEFPGDLAISPEFGEGRNAGEAVQLGDKNVLYPNATQDTDLILAPTTSGAEMLLQLRSPHSPSSFTFSSSHSLDDTAEGGLLLSKGNTKTVVSPPYAVDSQGNTIPVELTVDGENEFSIDLNSGGDDVAWPVLIDPEVISQDWSGTQSWFAGQNLYGMWTWAWNSNATGNATFRHEGVCNVVPNRHCWGSGYGLHVYSQPYVNYSANRWGHFVYSVPGGAQSYIRKVEFSNINSNRYDCNGPNAVEPHGYVGLWNTNTEQWHSSPRAWGLGASNAFAEYTNSNDTTGFRMAIAGMGSGTSAVSINCWRDFVLGGARIKLSDNGETQITAVSSPPGWVSHDATTIPVTGIDHGLGVKGIYLTAPTEPVQEGDDPGGKTWKTENSCTGDRMNPCPTTWSPPSQGGWNLNYEPDDMPEGVNLIKLNARDILGKWSPAEFATVKVDRSKPEILLGGSLASEVPFVGRFQTLEIRAIDGDPGPSARDEDPTADPDLSRARSGVTTAGYWLDGRLQDLKVQQCPYGSCQMRTKATIDTAGLSVGPHTVEAFAVDALGHAVSEALVIYKGARSLAPSTPPGTVLHTTRYSDHPDEPGSFVDSTWGVPGSLSGRQELSDGRVMTRSTQSCSSFDMPGENCGVYAQRLTMHGPDSRPLQSDWVLNVSVDPQDRALPVITEALARMDPSSEHDEGPSVEQLIQPWQRPPPGSGPSPRNTFVTQGIEGDIRSRVWYDVWTRLPILGTAVRQTDGFVLSRTLWDYDPRTYSATGLGSDFMELEEPQNVSRSTVVRSYHNETVPYLTDPETGGNVPLINFGKQKEVPGLGLLCLNSTDVVAFDYGVNGESDTEMPSDLPALASSRRAPHLFASTNYSILTNGQTCIPGERKGDGATLSIQSMDDDSRTARDWYEVDAQAAQVMTSDVSLLGPSRTVAVTEAGGSSGLLEAATLSQRAILLISGDVEVADVPPLIGQLEEAQ